VILTISDNIVIDERLPVIRYQCFTPKNQNTTMLGQQDGRSPRTNAQKEVDHCRNSFRFCKQEFGSNHSQRQRQRGSDIWTRGAPTYILIEGAKERERERYASK